MAFCRLLTRYQRMGGYAISSAESGSSDALLRTQSRRYSIGHESDLPHGLKAKYGPSGNRSHGILAFELLRTEFKLITADHPSVSSSSSTTTVSRSPAAHSSTSSAVRVFILPCCSWADPRLASPRRYCPLFSLVFHSRCALHRFLSHLL